ncbi:MAG: superoxide dismutase [Ni] [Calditrichaceae bacterium]|jgi:nickel superoxide dismutase
MHKKLLFGILLGSFIIPAALSAHCEIPCGIYNDKMRIDMLKEDVTTIEKSMNQIIELQKADNINYNQLVRWINNKEEHANKVQYVVTQYFMTQRIKLVDGSDQTATEKYQKELTLLHEMLVYAMKTKQTTELEHCTKLRTLIDSFYDTYFTEEEKNHEH